MAVKPQSSLSPVRTEPIYLNPPRPRRGMISAGLPIFIVMAGEASTTCSVDFNKVVGGLRRP